jgi:hypothetical protein
MTSQEESKNINIRTERCLIAIDANVTGLVFNGKELKVRHPMLIPMHNKGI